MGLSAALTKLNADRTVDGLVRDVLLFFRDHPHQAYTAVEVARQTGRPQATLEPVLLTLGRSFVLDSQSDPPSYRFEPDTLLELEVDRYLRRVHAVTSRLQDNVARFRERHGQR